MGMGKAFVGLLLVGVGIMLLLDTTDVLGKDTRIFGTYWPVLLIAWGFWNLATSGLRSVAWPLAVIAAGVLLLLSKLDVWSSELGDLWPVVLVVIGLGLLLGGRRFHRHKSRNNSSLGEHIFSGGIFVWEHCQ